MSRNHPNLKKDITFIYSDSAERHMYAPIVEEAEKRGYRTRLSENKLEHCEIGFYCQHVNYPQFSKFSLIMLHDIVQQHGNWPDIWYREPWDKYDIGILPSQQWVNNWQQCSQWQYARPKKGVYLVGWPKADNVSKLATAEKKSELVNAMSLHPSKRTVLYAPAWENDDKEIDFVEAVKDLGVNALVKQWDADPLLYPSQVANVERMARLHANVEGVTVLPPSTNIFTAIAVSDILVSEESSTMCEAAMMGVPAIAVSDWLIPDVEPHRLPTCDYDFVTTTTRAKLSETIAEMLDHHDRYKSEIENFSASAFSNVGNTSKMVMDIIDDCVEGKAIRYSQIPANPTQGVPLMKEIRRKAWNFKRELNGNQRVRYPIVNAAWSVAKSAKHVLKKIQK